MDEDEGEQRRLDAAPERVHEVSRHDGEQDHGRRALDKPRHMPTFVSRQPSASSTRA